MTGEDVKRLLKIKREQLVLKRIEANNELEDVALRAGPRETSSDSGAPALSAPSLGRRNASASPRLARV